MSQSSRKKEEKSKRFQYHGEFMRMSWGDRFSSSAAAVASLKNLIYFVYLIVEWESNLIIDKMFKVVEAASENFFRGICKNLFTEIYSNFIWAEPLLNLSREVAFMAVILLTNTLLTSVIHKHCCAHNRRRSKCKTINLSNLTLSSTQTQGNCCDLTLMLMFSKL